MNIRSQLLHYFVSVFIKKTDYYQADNFSNRAFRRQNTLRRKQVRSSPQTTFSNSLDVKNIYGHALDNLSAKRHYFLRFVKDKSSCKKLEEAKASANLQNWYNQKTWSCRTVSPTLDYEKNYTKGDYKEHRARLFSFQLWKDKRQWA